MKLIWRDFCFDFSSRTYIMGILNVTPDSFSDGGKFLNMDDAVAQACRMQEEGADIIDIGGESTRPGAEKVSVDDEIKRVVPVIEALTKKLRIPVSIDTYKSQVAEAAISAGASVINDISGLRFDPDMAKTAAAHDLPVIIMHIKGTPENMQKNPEYTALIPEIRDYLSEGIEIAKRAGVREDMIIVDPGIGFGKTVQDNLEIINRLDEFSSLGKPVLLGHSRKSFIGRILGDLPADQRVEGTAAVTAIGIYKGAHIVRVHDVKEMKRVAVIADSIKRGC